MRKRDSGRGSPYDVHFCFCGAFFARVGHALRNKGALLGAVGSVQLVGEQAVGKAETTGRPTPYVRQGSHCHPGKKIMSSLETTLD